MGVDLQALVARGNDPRYVTELLRDISDTETSVPVLTTAGRPDAGAVVVENERIAYASLTPTSFEGCVRGDGQDEGFAEARAHAGGARVTSADRPSFERAVADVVAGVRGDIAALQAGQLSSLPDRADFALKWGSNGNGNSQFKGVAGLATDESGNVYVTDSTLQVVKKFTAAGAFVLKTSLGGRLSGGPIRVCDDRAGNVWVTSGFGYFLRAMTYGGGYARTLSAWSMGLSSIDQMAADGAGKLWVAEGGNLTRIDLSGEAADFSAALAAGSGTGQFGAGAGGMAVDPLTGRVHVCDSGNGRVNVYDPAGPSWSSYGTPGAGAGQLASPVSVSIDRRNGWRHVGDADNRKVLVYDTTGAYRFAYGSNGTADGQFGGSVAVDASLGSASFVADKANYRIQKFTVASAGGGTGDVSSNVTSSSSGQAATFSGTTGKVVTPWSGTGIVKASGGVLSAAVPGDADLILPSQPGNSGKVLGTDGTNSSWVTGGGGSTAVNVQANHTTKGTSDTLDFIDGTNVTVTSPASDQIEIAIPAPPVTLANTVTLSNKTLDNTTTLNVKDTLLVVQDDANATRQGMFDLGNVTAGNTQTLAFPDKTGTLALTNDLANPTVFHPPGLHATNLTTATALAKNTDYALYLGRAPSAITSLSVRCSVTTAAASITWAEVAVYSGPPAAGGNAGSLSRVGWANVETTFNSTGVKTTTVSLSGVTSGDHLWLVLGSQATTPFQLRGMLADTIQSGVFQVSGTGNRPSTTATVTFGLAGATVVPPWVVAFA